MNYFLAVALLFGTLNANAQTPTSVDFFTSFGDFRIELYDSLMPITTGHFIDLIEQQYYDDVIFHRVMDGFVIQAGIGATQIPTIMDEFEPSLSNLHYTISMANTGAPNSGSTHFFINLSDNIGLDYDNAPLDSFHPIFGEVTSGFATVDSIGNTPTNSSAAPLTDVVIHRARLVAPLTAAAPVPGQTLEMELFPNPVAGQLTINMRTQSAGQVQAAVYDLQGRLVETLMEQPLQSGSHTLAWNAAAVPQGLYVLRIVSPEGIATRQVAVTR